MRIELDEKGINIHSQKGDSTSDFHDRINEAYDGKLGENMKQQTRRRVDWIVSKVSGDSVLDVGCSQGIVPILLGKKGIKVLGIDIEKTVIADANKALAKQSAAARNKVQFIEADFLKKIFSGDKYDTIIFSELLEHLYEPEKFIAKAYSLTKTSGRLIVTVPFGINDHPDHRQNFYTTELYMMLSKYFGMTEVEILGKWIGFVGAKKAEISSPDLPDVTVLDKTERAFYQIERELTDKVSKLGLSADETKLEELEGENTAYKKEINDLNELYLHHKEQAKRLREQKKEILNSPSYRVGRLATYPFRKLYSYKFVGAPLRFAYYFIRPGKKKILQGSNITYGDLYKPPKSREFYLRDRNNLPLTQLKVATIMDDFTYTAFMHECNIKQLTPENWRQEIKEFEPDLLLVESAWRGKDEKWRDKISRGPKGLIGLVRYCQKRNIPTAFWNKEDPAHTAAFLPVASMFDIVFTTDLDCVAVYRDVLCHERVYLLPFAAQPKINNPIEEYDRQDKFNFAGSYYEKYKERCQNFNSLVKGILTVKSIDIFDRNYNRDLDDKYRFPQELQKYVRGSLPYSEIGKAYKGYLYAININTVKHSPTMFARRAFELLASNTITVSNYSLGINNILGDLVISSDEGSEAVNKLKKIIKSELTTNSFRLHGLRNVMKEHTYQERLHYLSKKVFADYTDARMQKGIVVVAVADSEEAKNKIVASFERQQYANKKLVVLYERKGKAGQLREDVKVVNVVDTADSRIQELIGKPDFVSVFTHTDYYGPYYLQDLLLATKYSDADVIGKSAYYALHQSKLKRVNDNTQYRNAQEIAITRCIAKLSLLANKSVGQLVELAKAEQVYSDNTLSIDEFSYCKAQDGSLSKRHKVEVDAEVDVAHGGRLNELYEEAERISSDKKALSTARMKWRLRLIRTKEFVEEL